MKILLVDNALEILSRLQEMLQRRYTVELCTTLDELHSCYASQKYFIVIVALEMNIKDGYRAIEYIANINPDQRIVTYCTDLSMPSHHDGCEACIKTNRRHRIMSPIRVKDLVEEIENFDTHFCLFASTQMDLSNKL